jgi:hypothetical protein
MFRMDLVGKYVETRLSGRARGRVAVGEVLGMIGPGTSNGDALETLLNLRPDLEFSERNLRFKRCTASTVRLFVLVREERPRGERLLLYATSAYSVLPT